MVLTDNVAVQDAQDSVNDMHAPLPSMRYALMQSFIDWTG